MQLLDRLLVQAIEVGDGGAARDLLARGASANLQIEGIPILHLAVAQGIPAIVSLLIESGADLEQRSGTGMTALMTASIAAHDEGQVECLRILIAAGASLNERLSPDSWNAIDLAGQWRNRRAVEVLNGAGAKPTTPTSRKWVESALRRRGTGRSND